MFAVEEKVSVEDFRKISLKLACEVEYWCKILDVSEAELFYAVLHAGQYVCDVKQFLKKRTIPVQ